MNKTMRKVTIILGLWLAIMSIAPSATSQCAMCKKSAEDANAQEETKIASTLNSGVIYLLIMPYLAAGVVGFMWYRNQKKVEPQQ